MRHFPKKSIIIAILIFIALGAIITYAATGGGWLFKSTEAKGLVGSWPLDRQSIVSLGDNKILSATDMTSGNWTKSGGLSASSATIVVASADFGLLRQTFTPTSGKSYIVSFTAFSTTTPTATFTADIGDYDARSATVTFSSAPARYEILIGANTSSSSWFDFLFRNAGTFYITDISVREAGTADITPNANNATVYDATLTSDRDNQSLKAMSFNGTTSYVYVGDPDVLDFGTTQDFSVSVWFKTSASPTYTAIIGKKWSWIAAGAGYGISMESGQVKAVISDGTNLVTSVSGTTYSDGLWHHVVATYDRNGNQNLYVDNVLKDTDSISAVGNIDTSAMYIGRWQIDAWSGYAFFSGSIADVRIYNRLLSADEIGQSYSSYQATTHASSQAKGLVGSWLLDSQSEKTDNNKILNNTFSDTSAWVLAGGSTPITVQNGEAVLAPATNIYQAVSTDSGKRYKIKFDVHGTGGNYLGFHVASDYWSNNQIQYLANTRYTATTTVDTYFTATADKTYIYFREENGTDGILYLDNIYLSEVKASDSTSNANDGTVYGTIFTTDQKGQSNRASDFDGVSNYINIPNASSLGITNAVTIGAWVNASSSTTNIQGIVTKGTDLTNIASTKGYTLRLAPYPLSQVEFIVADDTKFVRANYAYTAGTWFNVMGTNDGTTAKLYINGVLVDSVDSSTVTNISPTDALYLGRDTSTAYEYLENGDFEINATTGWTKSDANASISIVADERTGGEGSYSFQITTGTTNSWIATQGGTIKTTPGMVYSVNAWVKSMSGNSFGLIAAKIGTYATLGSSSSASASWTNLSFTFTAQDATTYFYLTGPTGGAIGRFDDISVTRQTTYSPYLDGSMSDVRVYNRALSADEITTAAGSYRPKTVIGPTNKGLVSGWSMDSKDAKSDTIMADSMPSANDGTLSNMTISSNAAIDKNGKSGRSLNFSNPALVLDYSTWLNGQTGSVGNFSQNGGTSENYRILGNDPWEKETVVWEARTDGVSDGSGGWNHNVASNYIDKTKLYRFSVWVNRTVTGNGSFYLGTNGFGSVDGVYERGNGTNNTNPYFWVGTTSQGVWTLVVGHVWPAGSGIGSIHTDSGRYTVAGGKIASITSDFVWRTETTSSRHRAYLYYSTDTNTRQRFAYPRMDVVDGTEPTIAELLADRPGAEIIAQVPQTKTSYSLWYSTNSGSTWTHVVNSSGTYYVNGVTGTPTYYPIYVNGNYVYIGRTLPQYYFNGLIDDVRIYDRALSAQEVMALYQ